MKKEDIHESLRLRRGNSRDLHQVYEAFYDSMFFFAFRMVGNRENAEEIAGDTFLKIWKLDKDFDNYISIKAFLYITTKNACLNFLRKRAVRMENFDEQYFDLADPVYAEITTEIIMAIKPDIDNLPAKPKEIIKLILAEGLADDEIARRLKLKPKTVKNRKYLGIQFLQNAIARQNLEITALLLCFFLGR